MFEIIRENGHRLIGMTECPFCWALKNKISCEDNELYIKIFTERF